MVIGKSLSAEDVLQEAGIERYLKPSVELNTIRDSMLETLKSMDENPTEYPTHLEKVHSFVTKLWDKYDCKDIIEILDALTIVEPPLLYLERLPNKRYRDHYVHIFSVFVLGLRVLSLIIEALGEPRASDLLKVKDEPINSKIPEFHDYPWKERLFYLWTLIATFHDIAIPITHLGGVRNGLNEFLKKFGLEVSGPNLLPYFPSDLEQYFELLSCLFEGKMQMVDAWCYKQECPNIYMRAVLQRKFTEQDHGVLSGFLMYKKIEEIFLELERKIKHSLSPESFSRYTQYVLKQDIARAALAISLHNLKPDPKTQYPQFKYLPLDLFDYPLTYLLIIVDSLQEYLRLEGTSIRGGTKLVTFPNLQLDAKNKRMKLKITFFVTDEPDEKEYLIAQAQAMARNEGRSPRGETLGEAAQDLCDSMAKEIASQTRRNELFQIVLAFSDKNGELFSRDVHI